MRRSESAIIKEARSGHGLVPRGLELTTQGGDDILIA
jgi:hypothetical protein